MKHHMKHKKVIITLAACAVIVAGISGTYAILTASTGKVTNSFKPEVIETEIKENLDAENLGKEVWIHNIGPDDAFIRARVTISPDDVAEWKYENPASGIRYWEYSDPEKGGDGWYYYKEVVPVDGNTQPLMSKVELLDPNFEGDFDVTVYQEAVGTGSHKANEVVEDVSEIQKFFKAAEK